MKGVREGQRKEGANEGADKRSRAGRGAEEEIAVAAEEDVVC